MNEDADPEERTDACSNATVFGDDGAPPRGPMLLTCAVLVAAPTVILLFACACVAFWLIVTGGDEQTSPMNLLAAIVFPVPLLLILLFEYHAVVKRSAVAALLAGAVFLFPVVPGIVALADAVSGVLGQEQLHPDVWNWTRVATIAACVGVSGFIGTVHLGWWRRLMRWQCELAADEVDG